MAGRARSLNDLPDIAVEDILCRLPIKDAARTSVLSRYWRRRWHSIPVLDLSGLYRSQIDRALSLHSASIHLLKVEELFKVEELTDGYDEGSEMWQRLDVERWLNALSLRSASSLHTLVLYLTSLTWDLNLIDRCFPYLIRLELSGNFSVPEQFQGFTSLKVLYIVKFSPESEDDFNGLSKLISACSVLEILHLFNEDTIIDYSLDIIAPNLRTLELQGLQFVSFTVTTAPLLEFVHMYNFNPFEEEDDDNDGIGETGECLLMKVFRGMATIKELRVDNKSLEFLGVGHVPERIPICFYNLRIISLLDAKFGCERPMSVLLCLLRSCPSLRELEMGWETSSSVPEAHHDAWNPEAQEDVNLFNNLEAVTMSHTMCTKHEVGFIKFVLAKAKVLKTLKISFHQQVKRTDLIVADLLEFPRISNRAQILLARDSQATAAHRFCEPQDHTSPDPSGIIAGPLSSPLSWTERSFAKRMK